MQGAPAEGGICGLTPENPTMVQCDLQEAVLHTLTEEHPFEWNRVIADPKADHGTDPPPLPSSPHPVPFLSASSPLLMTL